jgi:hypothetical protein
MTIETIKRLEFNFFKKLGIMLSIFLLVACLLDIYLIFQIDNSYFIIILVIFGFSLKSYILYKLYKKFKR